METKDQNRAIIINMISFNARKNRYVCKHCGKSYKTGTGCFNHIKNNHMDLVVNVRHQMITKEHGLESDDVRHREPKINQYMISGERFNLYFAGKESKEAFKQVITELEEMIKKSEVKIRKV